MALVKILKIEPRNQDNLTVRENACFISRSMTLDIAQEDSFEKLGEKERGFLEVKKW